MISANNRYYGLGMDALVLGCSSSPMLSQMGDSIRSSSQMLSNMHDITAGAWMLWLSDAHEHGRYTVWAWMLWLSDAREHALEQMLSLSNALEHGRYHGLGMDTLVINALEHGRIIGIMMDDIMPWAWMLSNMDDTMTWARTTQNGRCPGYEIPFGKVGPNEPCTKKL